MIFNLKRSRGAVSAFFCAFTLVFYSGVNARAAEPEISSFPGDVLKETGRVFTSPARMSPADGYWLAGLAGGGLLIYSMDGQIRHAFKKNKSSFNDSAANTLEKLGNGAYDLGFLGVYGAAGCLLKKPEMTGTAMLAAESFAAANAAGTVVKVMAGRARPYAGEGKGGFTPFHAKTAYTSFPSGHATSAFSVASVIAARYESTAVGIIAYSLASGVAMQRIYADKHWASDVFAGAALGTVVGRAVVKNAKTKKEKTAYLLPVFAPGYSGALAVFSF
ncbi:MAG: phosphatase PAP2 family protein [Elusimicrobia bacterium]|nr:phosphatase PAP2 family protein [Elusimicrobiota bacterium]